MVSSDASCRFTVSGRGTRSESSVRERGHRICTSVFCTGSFFSRYFIVTKKDGGLRPILDLRVLNDSVMQLKFKMLTFRQIVPQIRSEDWFVTIDLKDAGTGGSVCISRDVSLSTLVLPHTSSSSQTGHDGADVAEASSVCISPDRSAPGSPGESLPGLGSTTSHCPAVAGQSMAPIFNIPSRRASSGDPRHEGPSVPSKGLNISPSTRTVETVGLASGLSTEFVEAILHSRAPSTRKLYALKWKVFTSRCSYRQLDPVNCPVETLLEFLQDRFTAGLTPSTLKVYVAAISAYHIPLGGMSLRKDPLVSCFLRGTLRLRPAARTRVPTWDLAIVLQGLSMASFEPLEEVPAKFLTLKALFLLSISSLKRIEDLQALSVAPSCLEFAPGMVKAFLHSRPGYVPKDPANVARLIILQAFCPPPFQNADQERHNLLCPVWALDAFVHSAALWHKNEQLFVCFGPPNKGSPASK